MIQQMKKLHGFYRTLGTNTRLVIRVTFISIITLLVISVYTYTSTNNPFYYEFLTICDELLNVTRSVAVVGFVGTLLFGYLERDNQQK